MALVTAVVQVPSLAWELPHAAGLAKKKKKKERKKKRDPRELPHPFYHVRTQQEDGHPYTRKQDLIRHQIYRILEFPGFRL